MFSLFEIAPKCQVFPSVSHDPGFGAAQNNRPLETAPWTSAPVGFAHWFNWGRDYIYRDNQDGAWATARPNILLTPPAIGERWGDPAQLIGLRFGRETNYFLLDIDAGSPYHDAEGPREIRAVLEDLGIFETVLIQSSHSGGWHLYGFLPAPVNSFNLATALTVALTRAGLIVAPGTLEIFPNRKAYRKGKPSLYNAHRLPLQPNSGSWLLDDDSAPFPGCESIDLFLDWAEDSAAAVDQDLLQTALDSARDDYKALFPSRKGNVIPFHKPGAGRLSNGAAQWQAELEADIAQGWTAPSQTNRLLLRIGTYGRVFLKIDSVEDLAAYIAETAQTMPGYAQFCSHQGEIDRRAMDWAKSVFKHYLPYCQRPERLNGNGAGGPRKVGPGAGLSNDERSADAQRRISECVEDLITSGRLPAGVTARRRLIAMLAGCSQKTLLKYLYLWHPDHLETPAPETAQDDSETGANQDADVLIYALAPTRKEVGSALGTHQGDGSKCRKSEKKINHHSSETRPTDKLSKTQNPASLAPCTSPRPPEVDFLPSKQAEILSLTEFRENRHRRPPPVPVLNPENLLNQNLGTYGERR